MTTFVFEGKLRPADVEDGGQAKITEIEGNEDSGLFVRVQSWDSTRVHEDFAKLDGKSVRIIVAVIEEI